MTTYPAVPTTLPTINPENSVEQNIQVLKSYQMATYDYKPKKPTGKFNTPTEMREMAERFEAYEVELLEYNYWAKTVNDYHAAIDQLIEDYIKSEAGFDRVPEKSRSKVWSKAWSDGHSSGYIEVYYHLCDLVELFD